jgi:DNA-binding Lrp family transcriptional regulator
MKIETQDDLEKLKEAIHRASNASEFKHFWDELFAQFYRRVGKNFANDEKLDMQSLLYYKAYMKVLHDIDTFIKATISNGNKAEKIMTEAINKQKEHIDESF